MRAILVSVDYGDVLALTLPHNRHHFSDVMVVTAPRDAETIDAAEAAGARIFLTESFWEGGADFNKFRALEQGLDAFGREGWLAIMDADVLWPRDVGMREQGETIKWHPPGGNGPTVCQDRGTLCAPLRRMWASFPRNPLPVRHTDALVPLFGPAVDGSGEPIRGKIGHVRVPAEERWGRFPLHRNVGEWAGYSQIFHADDPVLRARGTPWHETDWRHAGGADSFFQRLWPRERRVRPPWECLHLGEAAANWCGRVSPRLDGRPVEGVAERRARLAAVWEGRRRTRGFESERMPPNSSQG